MWRQLFGGDGLFNDFLAWFGIEGQDWISSPDTALYTLILLAVWQFGTPMVIFLAGLKQLPKDVYEAAAIDGASPVTRFFRITLPLLTPIVFFNVVLQIIDAFKTFTPAFVVSNGSGGPLISTMLYSLYLYKKGFTDLQMGLRLGARLGAVPGHRRLHGGQLHRQPLLGPLRRLSEERFPPCPPSPPPRSRRC
ncbi:sugar ABC transporter permease [Streptomyces thinghirensis]|nr:sugar ABC transporter permease [Streptomyces thinghirensis]